MAQTSTLTSLPHSEEDRTSFGISGRVHIYKKFDSGLEETVFHEDNLIVQNGKLLVLTNLYFPQGGGDPLAYAKVGTGGAYDPAGAFLKPVTTDMTDLFSPVEIIPIYRAAQDASIPSVTMLASVDNSQGNGLRLNEAGFFSRSGIMFNIKVFPGTLKTTAFALNFRWDIKII